MTIDTLSAIITYAVIPLVALGVIAYVLRGVMEHSWELLWLPLAAVTLLIIASATTIGR